MVDPESLSAARARCHPERSEGPLSGEAKSPRASLGMTPSLRDRASSRRQYHCAELVALTALTALTRGDPGRWSRIATLRPAVRSAGGGSGVALIAPIPDVVVRISRVSLAETRPCCSRTCTRPLESRPQRQIDGQEILPPTAADRRASDGRARVAPLIEPPLEKSLLFIVY